MQDIDGNVITEGCFVEIIENNDTGYLVPCVGDRLRVFQIGPCKLWLVWNYHGLGYPIDPHCVRLVAATDPKPEESTMTAQRVKVQATVTRIVQETREIPLVDVRRFYDDSQALREELLEFEIRPNSEVAIYVRDLPPGVTARKPNGETYYTRARSEASLFETLGVPSNERALMVGNGDADLWDPDTVVIVDSTFLFDLIGSKPES